MWVLDRRRWRSLVVCFVVVVGAAAPRAGAQGYTQTSQVRSMRVDVTARVPGFPDAVDGASEESVALGGFDRSISADTSAGGGAASVAVQGVAAQRVDYLAGTISGLLTARLDSAETAGQGGLSVDSSFQTEFRIGASDLPYTFSGRVTGGFDTPTGVGRSALGEFALIDLDTEDPHGGGTVVFSLSAGSTESFDHPRELAGVLLAGHRYSLMANAETGRELLNNPIPPGAFERSGQAEVSFALTVPEPGCTVFVFGGIMLSIRGGRRCEPVEP